MSLVAIGMDIFLAALLIAALVMGVRLNARLKALKNSHEGFARAIVELNDAAVRAERGLAGLREATTETHDSLLARIETARSLSGKLDGQIHAARSIVESGLLQRTPVSAAAPSAPVGRSSLDIPPVADAVDHPNPAVLKLAERFGVRFGENGLEPIPGRQPGLRAQRNEEPRFDRTAERAPAPQRPPQPTRRRNAFEDELFAPEPGMDQRSLREPAPRRADEPDMTEPLTLDRVSATRSRQDAPPEPGKPNIRRHFLHPGPRDDGSPAPAPPTRSAPANLATDDFASRIRARRAANG
jgi:hypothetical protein